jgi:hypothetical protein
VNHLSVSSLFAKLSWLRRRQVTASSLSNAEMAPPVATQMIEREPRSLDRSALEELERVAALLPYQEAENAVRLALSDTQATGEHAESIVALRELAKIFHLDEAGLRTRLDIFWMSVLLMKYDEAVGARERAVAVSLWNGPVRQHSESQGLVSSYWCDDAGSAEFLRIAINACSQRVLESATAIVDAQGYADVERLHVLRLDEARALIRFFSAAKDCAGLLWANSSALFWLETEVPSWPQWLWVLRSLELLTRRLPLAEYDIRRALEEIEHRLLIRELKTTGVMPTESLDSSRRHH